MEYNVRFDLFAKMETQMNECMQAVKSDNPEFGNPVTDYLSKDSAFASSELDSDIGNLEVGDDGVSEEKTDSSEQPTEERDDGGFLDYALVIEKNTKKISSLLNQITKDMGIMNDGIVEKNREIKEANRNSGNY